MSTFIINYFLINGFTLKTIENSYLSFFKRDKKGFSFIKVDLESSDLLFTALTLNFNFDTVLSTHKTATPNSIDISKTIDKIIAFIKASL